MTIFSVSKSATLALKDLLMKKIPKKGKRCVFLTFFLRLKRDMNTRYKYEGMCYW